MNWLVVSHGKSGKRELAIFVLTIALMLVGWAAFMVSTADFPTYKDFVLHIFDGALLFAAAAFGFDAAIKGGVLGSTPAPKVQFDERPHRRAADPPVAAAD